MNITRGGRWQKTAAAQRNARAKRQQLAIALRAAETGRSLSDQVAADEATSDSAAVDALGGSADTADRVDLVCPGCNTPQVGSAADLLAGLLSCCGCDHPLGPGDGADDADDGDGLEEVNADESGNDEFKEDLTIGVRPQHTVRGDDHPRVVCPRCSRRYRLTDPTSLSLRSPCCKTSWSTADLRLSEAAERRLDAATHRARKPRHGEQFVRAFKDGDPTF